MVNHAPRIEKTTNYKRFFRSSENRPLDTSKHSGLYRSMKELGFLSCFPIVCRECKKQKPGDPDLEVREGQHRFAFAAELGLPIYYVVTDCDFDIAKINCTPKVWSMIDYAKNFASRGMKDYQELIEFCDRHKITLLTAAGLLVGHAGGNNVRRIFTSGKFKITDPDFAERVASSYTAMIKISTAVKHSLFLMAIVACFRVDGFDSARMIQGAKRNIDRLVPHTTREGFLDMIEEIYNYNRARKNQIPLKFLAEQAMDERNAKGKQCPNSERGKPKK